MECIRIQGVELFRKDWDPMIGDYAESDTTFYRALGEYVDKNSEFTLRDIFNLLKDNPESWAMFESSLGGFDLALWMDEISKQHDPTSGVDYLEVYWHVDYMPDYQDSLEFNVGFHGFGDWGDGNKGAVSIGMTPLNKIADLEIKLDETFVIRNGLDDPVLSANSRFTLYDIISAILYEISFYGSPDSRDGRKEELCEMLDEIEKELEDV